MSLLDGLFVDRDIRSRAGLVIAPGLIRVLVEGLPFLEISFPDPCPNEDLTRFHSFFVRADALRESERRSIRSPHPSERTIGYLFPSACFDDNSEESPDASVDRYLQAYASAGVRLVLEQDSAKFCLKGNPEDTSDTASLAQVLDQDVALVVLGLEVLEEEELTIDQVRLMIQAAGYHPVYEEVKPRKPFDRECGTRNINLKALEGDFAKDAEELSRIISRAAKEVSVFGCFLAYYQVLELASGRWFEAEVQRVRDDAGLGPWDLKEALQRATQEERRLTAILESCVSGDSAPIRSEICRVGSRFVSLCNSIDYKQGSLGKVLYRVRNIIVHAQPSITDQAHDELRTLLPWMHDLVFRVIQNFRANLGIATDLPQDEDNQGAAN